MKYLYNLLAMSIFGIVLVSGCGSNVTTANPVKTTAATTNATSQNVKETHSNSIGMN